MRQVINEKDIDKLIGTWVVQLNIDQHDEVDFSSNPGFWLEKRIAFISRLYGVDGWPHIDPEESLVVASGIYYTQGIYTHSEFVKYWNEYIFTTGHPELDKGVTENTDSKGERYYRQLTDSELDWLTIELKKIKNK